MMKLLVALPLILAVQQEAAAFSGISLPSSRVQLPSPACARPSTTPPFRVRTYNKEASRCGTFKLSAVDHGEGTTSGGDKKIKGRKNRVIVGYKAMMISYLTVCLSAAIKAGLPLRLKLTIIGGYMAMPAGVSYIMISAAEHDRLSSDTYKRLNLALLEYGLLGLSVLALSGGNKILAVALLLSVINSIKGYAYGVLGLDKKNSETTLLKDLIKGTKDTVKGFLSVPKNFKSFGYLVAATMVASLKLQKLYEIAKFVQANSITAGISPLLSRFNRLAFLTLMVYTLKDAADRNRLSGTTFIQLNYLCALSMGSNYLFYTGGMGTVIGGLSAFFAAFFAFNGITAYMKNQYA